MQIIDKYIQPIMVLFICFVFIQSLFFKYTGSPETDYIFIEKLNPWAYDLTGYNLFAPNGIFSQYVIGTAELITSVILLLSLLPSLRWVRALGGLGAFAIMAGAVSFHLFTPLGVAVRNVDGSYDGGALFAMACLNLVFGLFLFLRNFPMLREKAVQCCRKN